MAAVTVIALLSTATPAQDSCASVLRDAAATARWTPSMPTAGALFRVRFGRTTPRDIAAHVAGERLHVREDSAGLWGLAAVPIDSARGVTVVLQCGAASPVERRIATQPGRYRLERLRVAPRFSAPPDSALAARLREEAAKAAAVSRGAHDTPRLITQPFLAPRATRITSGFGSGRTFNDSVTSRHMGTDYQGAVGAPVRAANRGVVREVGSFYLGGNVIYLDHGEGLVTAYLHLSKILVAPGDTVARGAIIGRVGATGRVTGPHLHFITRFGQVTVDPASVLRMP